MLRGYLPPVYVATPWLNDAEALVKAAQRFYGIEITVLRLLSHDDVTYLAETSDACDALQPWLGTLDEQSMRHSFAKPGGPAADLAWAVARLTALGHVQTGPAIQVRTWNLSSLWRIPVEGQTLWLKVVPPFFAHEGAVMARLAVYRVPKVLAHDGGRMLLAEIAGNDFYENATTAQFKTMIAQLIEIQTSFIGHENELLALGLPDWRLPALQQPAAAVLGACLKDLPLEDAAMLHRLLDRMPAIAQQIDACGLPPTLVHGDFHPGNVRGMGSALTVLDWGDSGLSHPLLDQTALLRHVAAADLDTIRNYWHSEWQRLIPGSNPARAAHLLQPLAALQQAIIRQKFIDNTEPAEHFYNLPKRAIWLSRAAALYASQNY